MMAVYNGTPKQTEDSFRLHVKVARNNSYFQHLKEKPISEKQFAKLMYLSVNGGIESLSTETINAYEQDLNVKASQTGDIYSIIPKNKENKILIYSHETGPEVFLLPISTILVGLVSGVLSNLAYDVLKDLYQKSYGGLKKIIQNWNNKSQKYMFDEKEFLNALEIKLVTPEGNVVVSFEKDKGLSPELVNLLTRRIKYYQENYTGK